MLNELRDLDFNDIGSAPVSVRYIILGFLLVIILAIGYYLLIKAKTEQLDMDDTLLKRAVNVGFSGGEKKRNEIMQMAILDPYLMVLDETDSGLDIDALRLVSNGINTMRGPDKAIILVTHYQRLLDYVKPDFVHVLLDGRIVDSGGMELAEQLERDGYAKYGVTEAA
jgi:Fe-S cluster assembly ATP-binding protein